MRLLWRGAIDHRCGIEDDEVREHARRYATAILDPHVLRREGRHAMYGFLERHDLTLADVPAEESREGAVAAWVWAIERTVGAQVRVRLFHDQLDVRLDHARADHALARMPGALPHRLRVANEVDQRR